MKNNKSISFKEKLTKLFSIDYAKNAKFLILIPVIIFALAVMMTCLLGLNYTTELKSKYRFTVDIGVEIEDKDNSKYIEAIDTALQDNDLSAYSYDKIGQNIYTGYQVTLNPTKTTFTDTELEEIQQKIEDSLNVSISDTIEVSDLSYVSTSISNTFGRAFIVLAILMVVAFVYTWIRFNRSVALGMLFVTICAPALAFAIYGLCRLPFGYTSLAIILISTVIAIALYIYVMDEIRNAELDENSYTNNQYIANANAQVGISAVLPILCFAGFVIVATFILIFAKINIAFILMAVLLAAVVAMYVAMYLAPSLWAIVYNKDKDSRLRSKIERIRKSKEKKANKDKKEEDNDKIVV